MTPTAVAQAPKPVLSPDAQIKATEAEIKANMTDLLSAMSNIQDEADRWDLADRLLKVVPQGTFGFERIIDAATQANVVGQFSATTLRLYRDTARNFPSDMRVKGCSFSAHREAERMPTIPEAIKVLDDLVKTKGSPSQVTVQAVRQAVRVRTGKTPPVSQTVGKVTSAGTGASTTLNEVFMDLKAGGTKLINAVPNTTNGRRVISRFSPEPCCA